MIKQTISITFAAALFATSAFSQAKNVILFEGDGGGVTSLNAASIYGYGKPQALYIQSMPHVGLADSSTSLEWVTDGAAAASAFATGKKGRNGVVSMSPDAQKDMKDGEMYKTVLECAEEKGLSTGLIDNEKDGITYAAIAASYSHTNNRARNLDIYKQFLNPRFGNGPDVVLVTSNVKLNAEVHGGLETIGSELKAKGYTFARSLEQVTKLSPNVTRLVGMFDSDEFDMATAVKQAVARLSKNPKGFFLVVHSDCHLGKTRASLNRLIELDKAIRAVGEEHKNDTLMVYTADHKLILAVTSLEDQHTAEEVPVVAIGPGSERVKGFMSNTDVFRVMMAAFGWDNLSAQR